MASPAWKVNWPLFGSVASGFISLTAVIMSNSRFAIVRKPESLRRSPPMAAPKYRPLRSAAAFRVLPGGPLRSAWARFARATDDTAAATAQAPASSTLARTPIWRLGRVGTFMWTLPSRGYVCVLCVQGEDPTT